VSQDIASLGSAAATITQISGASYQEAFTGTAKLSRGSNLGVSAPTSHSLAITGTASNAGQATSSGSVGLLSSFLGAPAQWSVRATGLNAKFVITLHDGASPFFSGAITQLDTSAKVATFRVDIGGNGFVLFSNNQKIKVSNWLMVNEPVN